MTYEEFKEWAAENIKSFLPHSYENAEITENHILKTGSTYDGLIVRSEGQKAVPTINLTDFYGQYTSGSSLHEIGSQMAAIVQIDQPSFSTFSPDNYENIRDHLFIRVCNAEENSELLATIPHDRIEDLAITYHIRISNENGSLASTTINSNLLKHWGIPEDQLKEDAIENSQKIFPKKTESLQDVVNSYFGEAEENSSSPSMLVVTNDVGINGAAAAFYPGTLEEISEKLHDDYYILPSSIHEIIVIPDNIAPDYHSLEKMVRDVNRMQVERSEQLSNHVYHYDSRAQSFELAESYEQRINNNSINNLNDFEVNKMHETTSPHQSFTMKF